MEYPFTIFVGDKNTMDRILLIGAKALNPKTMRYQVVCKSAKYKVVKNPNIETGYFLMSDTDIRTEAKEMNWIM